MVGSVAFSAGLLGMGTPGAAPLRLVAPAVDDESPPSDLWEDTDEERRAAAKVAFRRGRDAAAAGDYEGALEGFERARALEPTPGIHYNIAVCHHRLMLLLEEDSDPYEERRVRAIEAYNLYLGAAPDAEDRETVEDMVRSLGGHPVTQERWTIERLDPDPPSARPTPHPSPELREADEVDPSEEPSPEPSDPIVAPVPSPPPGPVPLRDSKPWMPRARVGVGFVIALSNMRQLSRTGDVATLPMLGLSLRGGAFLGARHRINLGGELALVGQPSRTTQRHRLGAGHLGVTIDYGHPIGKRRRFEIGGGGLVALAGQSLRHRGPSTVMCPAGSSSDTDREISQRGGVLLGGRLTLAALLGARRNHELALRITPGLGLFGSGTKGSQTAAGDACGDLQTPFEELGMNRPALVVTIDLGYAPRF